MKVFKFGGASLQNVASIKNIARIIQNYGPKERLIVVLSAMGKTTDNLESIFNAYKTEEDYPDMIYHLKKYHLSICNNLFENRYDRVFYRVEKLFSDLEAEFRKGDKNFARLYDQTVCYGELLSSYIFSAYLAQEGVNNQWLDARKYIQTDDNWKEGIVDWAWSEKLMKSDLPDLMKGQILVTQGFLGGTVSEKTATLGREGSDFSAAIFAYCLDAESVTIWKDVPGILNADPRRIHNTCLFSQLPYKEAAEMTYYGATVIHPKTIKPLAIKKIPLYVKSFIHPEEAGTCIGEVEEYDTIPAIIFKPNQSIIRFEQKDYSSVNQSNLSQVFNLLAANNVKINLMKSSAISFSICANTEKEKFEIISERLSDDFYIDFYHGLELITIKNYNEDSLSKFSRKTIYWEQKTRNIYQIVRES
ncbi:aspartate kinase [Rapidithrix thailandica]|uniref:Aspartokinase n=1 Tax=Rapidithrix thailandica TaxID=413964 RepID=A0AAW9S438_9BACT